MDNIKVKPILALQHGFRGKQSIINKIIINLIRWRTGSKYFHSEIILDGKWISSNVETGVVIKFLRPLDNVNWDYITLPERELTSEQHEDLWVYINTQDGKDYDFFGIFFSQLIKFGKNNIDKWFCSELGAKIVQLIGYTKFMDIVPADMDPGDMSDICRTL